MKRTPFLLLHHFHEGGPERCVCLCLSQIISPPPFLQVLVLWNDETVVDEVSGERLSPRSLISNNPNSLTAFYSRG